MDFDVNVEIGDFRIERRVGAGGMGVVYLARQLSLDRVVALKVLGAALAHPADILRFKREAQAAAKLKHPGIATIYYIGQDEQACYMAMDYIDGITLRQLIDRLGTTHNMRNRPHRDNGEGVAKATPLPTWSVEYEEIYLKAYGTVTDLDEGLRRHFDFYDHRRKHQALSKRMPYEVHQASLAATARRRTREPRYQLGETILT